MTNKFSSNPDEEDAKIILQQFSIQRYLRLHSEGAKIDSLFCLQLIRPENKRHLVTSGDNGSTDLVICLNEFKMGVIAKAVIFPVCLFTYFPFCDSCAFRVMCMCESLLTRANTAVLLHLLLAVPVLLLSYQYCSLNVLF